MMCNYGSGIPLQSLDKLEAQFDAQLDTAGDALETLILCTNGSFLDDMNVPVEAQRSLLRRAQQSVASTVIIETHLDTLSQEKLRMVRTLIPEKPVILELGLESANPFVQKNCYLKEVPLDLLEKTMASAEKIGFAFQLNVILGAPFLSKKEQMDDAEQTIRWALSHRAMSALFPMNIKPYTLLRYAYRHGLYTPISHWMMPLLLSRFSADELAQIDLAWYGNRQIRYDVPDAATVFPADCSICHEPLQRFYQSYVLTSDGKDRRRLVEKILASGRKSCVCMEYETSLLTEDSFSLEERVRKAQRSLLSFLERETFGEVKTQ